MARIQRSALARLSAAFAGRDRCSARDQT